MTDPRTQAVLDGDIRTTARLIRDIDDEMPGYIEALMNIYPHTGKAHLLGITGLPGAGKSTLVDQIVEHIRMRGSTVGLVLVDPTSPFSGGAILGDRIRMQRHYTDPGVFIRSVATRGHLGGISRSTNDIVNVLDAMGKDTVIVETVGVGQDETEIASAAHTTVVVLTPGMGDEIQAIKAGILEVGDIFVINKADRDGTDRAVRDLETMLDMDTRIQDGFRPPVVTTEALSGRGLENLMDAIESHRVHILQTDQLQEKKRKRAEFEVMELLKESLLTAAVASRGGMVGMEKIFDSVSRRNTDPYSEVQSLIQKLLKT
ncbi:MAG: methylmalonyl Co-A mutase-associated GTPase MeaB [Deltaproteobacteria bacterium]|nr:methylmalonyl Co-A mutase-associated GTPase MeaB [Candidatus Zymogenaceae bacterium]